MRLCLGCRVVPIVASLFTQIGTTNGDDYAPYAYGNWTSLDPGAAGNVEYIAIHPIDPNVVIAGSDAFGQALTCDGGQTWAIVNKGILGGALVNGQLGYIGLPPMGAIKWDPIDPNFVYVPGLGGLFRGLLRAGRPGTVAWQWVGAVPQFSAVCDLVFDPDPDPAHTGRAQIFYTIDQFGRVAFTNNGGLNFYRITRIPGSLEASSLSPSLPDAKAVFDNWQNPLLAIHPASAHNARLILVPCPGRPLVAWGVHNQLDPTDPASRNPSDPNTIVQWTWDEPNLAANGLPDPNRTRANGLILRDLGSSLCTVALTCNNSSGSTGGVYTREIKGFLWQGPWQRRGSTFQDPMRVIAALTPHPRDPNICYLGTPRGDDGDPRGILRSRNFRCADPNATAWETLTDPNLMELGPTRYTRAGHVGALDVCSCDPNIMYFSCDYLDTFKSTNGGATWKQVYSTRVGDGGWRHRGLLAVHTQSVIMAPSDPNIIFVGRNDAAGCYKTTNRGRSFSKFFCLDGNYQPNCAPQYLTYAAGGTSLTRPATWFVYPGDDPNWWTAGIESNVVSGLVHPTDPNRAWFVTFDEPDLHCSLVTRTVDGAAHLTIVLPSDARKPDTSGPKVKHHYLQIASDRDASRLFLAAGQEGVLMSVDEGSTWTVSLNANDPNLVRDPNTEWFVTVDVCKADPNVVYAASGRRRMYDATRGCVYRSLDAGHHWARVMSDPANITCLLAHPDDPNVVYAAVNDWELTAGDGGVWESRHGGFGWTRIFPSEPAYSTAFITAMALDPQDPNILYCANSEVGLAPAYANRAPKPGIYLRLADGGWITEPRNPVDPNSTALPDMVTRYYSLTVNPQTRDVYVGTSAGAFWFRPLRSLSIYVWPDDANDPNYPAADWGSVAVSPPAPEYADGTTVTLTVTPNGSRHFVRWVGDLPGGVSPYASTLLVPMDQDRTLWATFEDTWECGGGSGLLLPVVVVPAVSLFWRRRFMRSCE
jgi:hypothetical protein